MKAIIGKAFLVGTLTLNTNLWGQNVINGSFEAPGQGTVWDFGPEGAMINSGNKSYISIQEFLPAGSTKLTGWDIGGGGVTYQADNAPRAHVATDGMYTLNLTAFGTPKVGGSISQTITGLKPGTNYYVFFDLQVPSISEQTRLTVDFGSQTRSVVNTKYGEWQTHQLQFTATQTSQLLKLSMPTATADWNLLDNVRVSASLNAPVKLEGRKVVGLKVEGTIGKTYRIEYCNNVDENGDYVFLERVTITQTPMWVYDITASDVQQRFYRSVEE